MSDIENTTDAILPNGRLNPDFSLGRKVAPTSDVLEVIRPQLRMMRVLHRGQLDAMREGWLSGTPDLELEDPGDTACDEGLFYCLLDGAIENVKGWSRDLGYVFDANRLREFCRQALFNAMTDKNGIEMLPEGALEY